jgi:hypothetical protein
MEEINRIGSSIALAAYLLVSAAFWPMIFIGIIYIAYKIITSPEASTSFFGKLKRRFSKVSSEVREDAQEFHNSPPETRSAQSDAEYEEFVAWRAQRHSQDVETPGA